MAIGGNIIIQQGATISELAVLFGLDRKQVRERLGDAPPSGARGQNDYWRVKDVASRLVNLGDESADLISRILALNHTQLPKMLAKEYWLAQSHRIKVLREIGELWDTSAVVDLASAVFKTLRLSLTLAADTVERETGITPEQRAVVERLMAAVLVQIREAIDERLTNARERSAGKTFAPAQTGSTVDDGELDNLGLDDPAEELGLI